MADEVTSVVGGRPMMVVRTRPLAWGRGAGVGAALLGVLIASCAGRARAPAVEPDVAVTPAAALDLRAAAEFRGIYASGFEVESFQPCSSEERWWVIDAGPLRRHYRELATAPYEPVYAVIRGDTTRRGHFGHLGLYQRYLRVHEVVEAGGGGCAER